MVCGLVLLSLAARLVGALYCHAYTPLIAEKAIPNNIFLFDKVPLKDRSRPSSRANTSMEEQWPHPSTPAFLPASAAWTPRTKVFQAPAIRYIDRL